MKALIVLLWIPFALALFFVAFVNASVQIRREIKHDKNRN